MSWFSKPKPVEAVRGKPERTEAIRLERGAAFKAIDRWYAMDTPGWDTREWDAVLMIRGFCQRSIIEATGQHLDETDFYLRLLDYVRNRGGKVIRIGGSIYVSARFPHAKKRGDFEPSDNPAKDFMPNDPRLVRALKALGVDTSKVRWR